MLRVSWRALAQSSLLISAVGAVLVMSACGKIEAAQSSVDFGEVYISHVAGKLLLLHTGGDVNGGFSIEGADATAFEKDVSSYQRSDDRDMSLTLRFAPKRVGDHLAELTVVAVRGGAGGFPVRLAGRGVFQKIGPPFLISATDHPPDAPLDFGDVAVGKDVLRSFRLKNDSSTSETLQVLLEGPAFTSNLENIDVVVAPNALQEVPIHFAPPAVGPYVGLVELRNRAGDLAAGIVLVGRGVINDDTFAGVQVFTPTTISPGETITVLGAVRDQTSSPAVQSMTFEGLPPNAPGGSSLAVQPATGFPVDWPITVGPPAMDGKYPLKLHVQYKDGTTSDANLGTLTVRDVPARVTDVVIRDDHHTRHECEQELIKRTLEYRLTDDNGASDVLNARIEDVQPSTTASDRLMNIPPTMPIFMPGKPDVVTDLMSIPIDMRCQALVGNWTLVMKIDEDDKTVEPPAQSSRIRVAPGYRVDP